MPQDNSKEKVDDLALKLFKQIGLKEDEIESTMDLINLIESTPKKTPQTELIAEPPVGITETERIRQLEKIMEEQRKRIEKYEEKIGPKLILMIKSYLDKLNSANNEVQKKQQEIIQLESKIAKLKQIIQKLRSIWQVSEV
ncbi:MAG: hypothetical protein ACFFDN_09720 [Candidatus Hodarchaeota archaeon]